MLIPDPSFLAILFDKTWPDKHFLEGQKKLKFGGAAAFLLKERRYIPLGKGVDQKPNEQGGHYEISI